MKHAKKILSVAIAFLLLFSTASSVFAAEPPATPSISLAVDTGYPGDNITQNGTMNIGNLEIGATWEYSINSGVNWIGGTGTTFVLPDGTYTAGMIEARQVVDGVYSESASNLTTIVVAQNQIYNGDFQLERTGFTTDYWYNGGDCQIEGTYTVTNYSRNAHPSFAAAYDHTLGNSSGRMFVANGSYDITNVVWQSTSAITVQAGQEYRFEAYLASFSGINTGAADGNGYPKLKFQIGDGTNWVDLGTSQVEWGSAALGAWFAIYADGTFSNEGTYYIRLINQQPDNYNDFGVDDIYFGLRGAAPSASDPGTNPTSTPSTFDTSTLLSLELQSDTGYSDTDKITYNGVINVLGLQPPNYWQYSVDGGDWVTGSGTTFTVTGSGAHSVVVRQMDYSEMWSDPSAPLNFTLDATAPTVEISRTVSDPTNANPIPIVLTFSEDVYGLSLDDITVTNGTKSNLLGSGSNYTMDVTPDAEGTVTVTIGPETFQDIAGNNNQGSAEFSIEYDITPPSNGSVSINSGATYSTSTFVTLTLESTGATRMMISENADFSGASFESYATSKSITLSSTNGTKTIYVKYADTAGNETTPVSDTIILDTQKPTVTITSTESNRTNADPIPITITFNESVSGFELSDIAVSNGAATNLSGSGTTYTADVIPYGELTITVDVYSDVAQDTAGNGNSAATQFVIVYDETPPTSGSVSINSGAMYTNSTSVSLSLSATDAVYVMLSEDADFTGASYSSFVTSKTFALSSGDGEKTVYVRYKDEAGNETTGTISDSIILDTTGPTVTISSTEMLITNVDPIPITIMFNEGVTGFDVTDIVITNGTLSNFSGAGLIYTADITPTADGAVTVNIAEDVATDAIGNGNSAATQFSIVSDQTPPSAGTISINDGETETTDKDVTLRFFVIGATQMMYSENADFSGASYELFVPLIAKSYTLSDGDGTKTIYVKYKDPAGNETTETISASILLDTTPPTNGSISINNGASFTYNKDVTLTLNAVGAVEMIISDQSDFSGASYETYATSKTFTLSSGDGTKIVYVKYKDELGNETDAISDRIVLDTYVAPEPLYGTVFGYITDVDGNPIPNVLVELHSDPLQTYTDADGYFEFTDVPVGEHMLYVLDDRFETSSGLTVAISSTVNGVCTEDECGGDELDNGLKVEVGDSQELKISFVAQANMTTSDDDDSADDTDDTIGVGDDDQESSGFPTWAFWLIGAGVLGAIFFIIFGKRRKDDEEEEE